MDKAVRSYLVQGSACVPYIGLIELNLDPLVIVGVRGAALYSLHRHVQQRDIKNNRRCNLSPFSSRVWTVQMYVTVHCTGTNRLRLSLRMFVLMVGFDRSVRLRSVVFKDHQTWIRNSKTF